MIFNRNAYNALLTCDHGSSNSCHKVLFVYFKQKTAYEMRISDWISDVCSSDLLACFQPARLGGFQLPLDFAPFLHQRGRRLALIGLFGARGIEHRPVDLASDRKSTRLNSSH